MSNKWINFNFAPVPQKRTRKKPIEKKIPERKSVDSSLSFQQSLTPRTVSDLAVHSKKITEVESWLGENLNKEFIVKFLLITGPSGAGKTSTVRVLCRKLNITLMEWVNPLDHDFELYRGSSQTSRFMEFLSESKFASLTGSGSKKVILVEEFPNAFMRNPGEFETVLEDCYYRGNCTIIFIVADSTENYSNHSYKLFPDEIKAKFHIATITFNACAATLLKSALKRAQSYVERHLNQYRIPSQDTVNGIITTAMGDIRTAINQYYFASLRSGEPAPSDLCTKRKRASSPVTSLLSRDESLGLFHGLGRVLNPKFTPTGKLQHKVENLIDEFRAQPSTFTAFLFENYRKYFGDINDVFQAAEALSLAMVFLHKWVDHDDTLIYAMWVSVLGLMVANRHKESKWTQITAPRKINRRLSLTANRITPCDLYYYNIINKVGS